MQARSSSEQGSPGGPDITIDEQGTASEPTTARPEKGMRKQIHPSLPSRYRALKRRQRFFKVGLGVAVATCALLCLALVHVNRTDRVEIRELTRELMELRYELSEVLRSSISTDRESGEGRGAVAPESAAALAAGPQGLSMLSVSDRR